MRFLQMVGFYSEYKTRTHIYIYFTGLVCIVSVFFLLIDF